MDQKFKTLEAAIESWYGQFTPAERNERMVGHWWDHVAAVTANCIEVAKAEAVPSAQIRIVASAALCHDLGYFDGGTDQEQADRSMRMALSFCSDAGYSTEEAESVASLIPASDRDLRTATLLLERILYVGDKLDLFGFPGTVRLLMEESGKGVTVRHELAAAARVRQADWLDYMSSLDVGVAVVAKRAEEAEQLLQALLLQVAPSNVLDLT